MKLAILGNSGSGKTTLARRLIGSGDGVLSLDAVAWNPGPERKSIAESRAMIEAFAEERAQWAIEGCYADLLAIVLPECDELIWLNPPVETCLARCRARQHEPDKFATKAEQDAALAYLLEWVAEYETRDDEFGLKAHRRLYDGFDGPKRIVVE